MLFDRKNQCKAHKRKVRNILRRLYGKAIIPYVNTVFKIPRENYNRRMALVDLVINDEEVILAHRKNKMWINGRYGTWFRSSFLVSGKIPPEHILSVEYVKCNEIVWKLKIPPFVIPEKYISLRDLV